MTRLGLSTASLSDVGRVRTRNEDCYGEFSRPDGTTLLVVADGMGGHRAGAIASRITVDTVGEVFGGSDDPPAETLRSALETANARVHEMANAEPDLRGMGTTVVALLVGPEDEGVVAHVGDSRLYRYRDQGLRALTRDHSIVAELERRGLLTAEEAAVHPRRNEIMRSIGVEPDVEVELLPIEMRPGDRYLLCSDGLSGMLDETEIAVILAEGDPEQAARELIDRANEHGGTDNITVQIAALTPPDDARAGAATGAANGAATGAARDEPRRGRDRRLKRRALMGLALLAAVLAAALILCLVRLQTDQPTRSSSAPRNVGCSYA